MCIQMFFKGRLVFVAFLTIVTNKGQGLMDIFNVFFQCCMSEKVKGTSLHCAMVGQFILFQCLLLSNNLKLIKYIFNRSSRRKRGMASNPLFIIPDFFCIFQTNFAMATLGLKEFSHFLQT